MADQQNKKTQTGPTSGAGSPTPKPIPATGQDKPNTGGPSNFGTGGPATGAQTQPKPNTISSAGNPNSTISDNSSPNITSGTGGASDQPISEKLSSTANGILDKAKETASGTYDAVATQATEKIEEHKGELSSGLRTLADTFRKTGTDLESTPKSTPLTDVTARYTGVAARQIENVASYFERKDLRAMMRDTEGFARRNPAIFLGAAFAIGMVAARFLKSSKPDRSTSMNTGSLNTNLPTALPSGSDRPDTLRTNP
jgi:ElaB/YqjD/DUF883 family membrane-anchored ribosome-binding protein